jgi:hypothetical protein
VCIQRVELVFGTFIIPVIMLTLGISHPGSLEAGWYQLDAHDLTAYHVSDKLTEITVEEVNGINEAIGVSSREPVSHAVMDSDHPVSADRQSHLE